MFRAKLLRGRWALGRGLCCAEIVCTRWLVRSLQNVWGLDDPFLGHGSLCTTHHIWAVAASSLDVLTLSWLCDWLAQHL